MIETEIDANQLTRVLIQHLKENGLTRTAQCLQDETGVILNSIDDPTELVSDITNGRWDKVMQSLSFLSIPSDNLRDLFNQITLELIDYGAPLDSIKRFIDMAAPLHSDPLLRSKLIALAEAGTPTQDESERTTKRKKIAKTITSDLPPAIPPGRLLSLIASAAHPGRFNLLTGEVDVSEERRLSGVDRSLTLPKGSFAEAIIFSPDGNFLIVGSSDGLIEVFSSRTLLSEKPGNFMFHSCAVTALAFSGGLLVSGDAEGNVKTWKFLVAEKVSALKLHVGAVNSFDFMDSSTLTASSDGSVKISKSNRIVKDFRIPGSPMVYDAKFIAGGKQVILGSSDGNIQIWDIGTGCMIKEFMPPRVEGSGMLKEIKRIVCDEGLVIVGCSNTKSIYGYTENGLNQFTLSSDSTKAVVSFITTKRYVYAVYEDGKVVGYSRQTYKEEVAMQLPACRPNGPTAFNQALNSGAVATREGQLHFLD